MTTLVYKYAVRGRVPDAVLAEVHRAHILRNKITEIHRASDEKIAAVYAGIPDVKAAQAAADAARQAADELSAEIRRRKQAARTGRPAPELAVQLGEARAAAKAAAQRLREAKAAARDAARGQVKAARDSARAAVKGLYAQSGDGTLYAGSTVPGALYWATFNLVAAQQDTAMDRVIALRAQHRPAELRFRRWDWSGTIAVQLQREAGDPARTPAMLADGEHGKWRNVALLVPGRSEADWAALPAAERKKAELRFRLGAGDSASWETVRLVMHRPLPDGCDIAMVQLSVREVPSGFRGGDPYIKASVSFTVKIPDPAPAAGGPAVAVHCGWRVLDDGAVRVAVITGLQGPPPAVTGTADPARVRARRAGKPLPPLSQETGLRDHGSWQEVVIPQGIRDLQDHAASLRGIRDRELEAVKKTVAAHLARCPEDAQVIDPQGSLERWRSPRRMARAMSDLRAAAPDSPLLPALEGWRQQDLHLAAWEHGERSRHVLGWRRNLYREVAAWVASQAGTVVIDSWDAVRRRPDEGEEESPQQKAGRANAVLASPGEFRQAVTQAAGRRGVSVVPAEGGLSRVHHGCGGDLPAEKRRAAVTVVCRDCGRKVDQDVNAAQAMVASAAVVP